jgi:hypothetical protein
MPRLVGQRVHRQTLTGKPADMATYSHSQTGSLRKLPAHIRAFATVTAMSGLRPAHRDAARHTGTQPHRGRCSADVLAQLMRVLESNAGAKDVTHVAE